MSVTDRVYLFPEEFRSTIQLHTVDWETDEYQIRGCFTMSKLIYDDDDTIIKNASYL